MRQDLSARSKSSAYFCCVLMLLNMLVHLTRNPDTDSNSCPTRLMIVFCSFILLLFVFLFLGFLAPSWRRCPLQATFKSTSLCLLSKFGLFGFGYVNLVTTNGFVVDKLMRVYNNNNNNLGDFVSYAFLLLFLFVFSLQYRRVRYGSCSCFSFKQSTPRDGSPFVSVYLIFFSHLIAVPLPLFLCFISPCVAFVAPAFVLLPGLYSAVYMTTFLA